MEKLIHLRKVKEQSNSNALLPDLGQWMGHEATRKKCNGAGEGEENH